MFRAIKYPSYLYLYEYLKVVIDVLQLYFTKVCNTIFEPVKIVGFVNYYFSLISNLNYDLGAHLHSQFD